MLRKIILAALIFSVKCYSASAQNPLSELSELSFKAESLIAKADYDSAVDLLTRAEIIIDENKLYKDPLSSIVYNYAGTSWEHKQHYNKAHFYFTKSLKNAAKYGHQYESQLAIGFLNNLHRLIKKEDLSFNYPPVKETELSVVMFGIASAAIIGDSVDVIVEAGKYDGITDSIQLIDIFTHSIMADSSGHDGLNFISSGRILKLTNNQCSIRTERSEISILKGDLAFIRAYTPASWRTLKLYNMLMHNLYLVDNYRQFLYDYRYFYYYADSATERQTFLAMHETIKEVAEKFAADTIDNPRFSEKIKSGIFQGYNVIAGMLKSNPENIVQFFNYVNFYPAKYIGNNYKISETYATWMINNTPLAPDDVKPYLLKFPAGAQQRNEIAKLAGQIKDDNLTDQWLDDGMQQANIENIEEANRTANLLRETYALLKDESNAGWSNYIKANIQKRLYNNKAADSLLTSANKQFEKAGNAEGVKWVYNTRQLWKKSMHANAGVQNGHLFSYELAQSYNPRFFATGGSDNLIKIWDRNLGKEILTLNDHRDEINALIYSSNGRYLASAGQDDMIHIFNAYNYGRIYSIKTNKAERAIAFSPNNELLASAGLDSLVKIRDFKKNTVVQTLKLHKGLIYDICYHPVYSGTLFSAGSDSLVYRWDVETGEMTRWYKLKGKVISVKISSDGQYMSTVSTDSVLSLWNLQNNRKVATYRISVFMQGINRYFAEETFSPDGKYLAFPFAKDSFAIVRLRDRSQRDYGTSFRSNHLADLQFSKDGLSLFARFNAGGPLMLYNFANWDIENNSTISSKDIKSYANVLVSVQFIANDNKLAVLHSGTSKIDLRNGRTEHVDLGAMGIETRTMFLNDEKKAIRFDPSEPAFNIYEYASRKNIATYSLPSQETIASFELSSDNKYAFLGGHFGYLYGWNIETGAPLFGKEYTEMNRKKLQKIIYDKYRHRLMAVTDSVLFILDASNGNIVKQIELPGVTYAVASGTGLYVGNDSGYLYKYDITHYRFINKILLNNNNAPLYQLLLSNDEKILFARNNYTDLTAVQTATGKILYNIRDHDYEGSMLAINKDGTLLASAGFDSNIKLYEPGSGKRIADIFLPLERDAIIIDTAGYYLAPKNSLDALLFSFNNTAFTYEQFDAQYNRPDLVLRKLKRSDTTTLSNYYTAYKKRLSKLNIKEQSAEKSLQIPTVRLLDKFAVQTVTTEKEFYFWVECSDNLYPLKNLQVLVNNNPVLGIDGRDLSHLKTKNSRQKISVKLSTGPNIIKIFCSNMQGGRSLNEQLEIFAKYTSPTPAKAYFIGIAVNDYKDSSMNLQYSVKDIRDLARTFDNLYANLEIDTLINEGATRENIVALRKKLEHTGVNDRVILAVTGHGLLSKSFDFYYATWDNDFSDPASRGIKYDELEGLLTDIPARKKLMLIDACHSGALDKEELLAQQTTIQKADTAGQVTGVVTRGVIKISKNSASAPGNSFEMMQKLFTDLKGNNGAVIISAAGGMEYALESPRWSNGVFTYCVRMAIEERLADTEGGNYDGKISVQELQQFVSKKVSELTGGKQQPTNRRENPDFEWFIRN
jgi:WD40 repeat protein